MKKAIPYIIAITIFCFWGIPLYKDFKSRCEYYHSSFQGKVSNIRYTQRKLICIKIKPQDKWIYLGYDVKRNANIEVGDKLIKKEDNYHVILVKKNGTVQDITSDRNFEKKAKYCKCLKR